MANAATTFHSLSEAHAKDVYRFARYLTGSDDAAADIASETFLRAWSGRDAIRVETAKAVWAFWCVAGASWVAHSVMRREVRRVGL